VVRTVPNRARPRRRELLSRISSQEIQINDAAALTIRVEAFRLCRGVSRREIEAQRESHREIPGGK